ncbi:uncharacterized protein V6R79_006838 [Siganus canaliculatus]
MEETMQWAANVMDHKTEKETKAQAEERVRCNSTNVRFDLDLCSQRNLTELCGQEKVIKKRFSPSVSVETSVDRETVELLIAASQGKLEEVDKYLTDGGDPNVHDELKRTALHRASLEGHTSVVQRLLEKGANINFKDQLGSRAIHWACRGGSLEVVKVLKSYGADLNTRDELYSTPLHVATRTGHTAIVEFLLSCGAKVNSRDREGDTALHDAVRLNRYKIVKLLIAAKADTEIKNHEGATAMQQAKQWQSDILETLQRLDKMREVSPENTTRKRTQ